MREYEKYWLKKGTELNGKYEILDVIDEGGSGIVYLGFDKILQQQVSIKEYFPRGVASRGITETISHSSLTATLNVFTENTEQAKYAYQHGLQTYIKEAENLSHFYTMSGIVSVRDFFYGNNTAYIVMEYIEGID